MRPTRDSLDTFTGGVITALLDEVMSRVSLLEDRWTITASMDIKFRRPICVEQTVHASAEKTRHMRRFIEVKGTVTLPDGNVAAEAAGRFVFLKGEDLDRISAGYPELSRRWGMGSER